MQTADLLHFWDDATLWVPERCEVSELGSVRDPALAPWAPTFNTGLLNFDDPPYYADWSALGALRVYHEGIIPSATYEIQLIDNDPACDRNEPLHYSLPLTLTTPRWGDIGGVVDPVTGLWTAPNGVVEMLDVLGIVERFRSAPTSPAKARADVEPRGVDLIINMTDVLHVLYGFVGVSYPFDPSHSDPRSAAPGDVPAHCP